MGWNREDWLKTLGLLGLGATGVGLAGYGPLAGILGTAEGAVPMAAMGGDAAVKASQAMLPANKALGALKSVGNAMSAANAATGLLGQQPQPATPPPPNQFQATPVNPAYGMSMDTPPAGIDPRQWAMMTEDQKRRFKGGV